MNWRSSRPRPAPSAVRIANSRCRVSARASSRFARLAQAISSTNPTAACSTQMARLALPTISCCTGFICRTWPPPGFAVFAAASLGGGANTWFFAPTRSPQFWMSAVSSVFAACSVTPSFKRPIR